MLSTADNRSSEPSTTHALTENQSVVVERVAGHTLVVTINRPGVLNAVDSDVARGIAAAVSLSEADQNVRAVVLTGQGDRAFCTGADLKFVSKGRLAELFLPIGGFGGFVQASRTKPWIAAVDGFALAGGFEIALACDLIVASENSEFGLPEVRRGILASAGGAYRLSRRIPLNIANELICTGQRMSCDRASRLGLINRVVPRGGARQAAIELASAISEGAPIAIRESLRVARKAHDLTDEQLYEMSQIGQMIVLTTKDSIEGPLAFLEKRNPIWLNE